MQEMHARQQLYNPDSDWKPLKLTTGNGQYMVAKHKADNDKISIQFLDMQGAVPIEIVVIEDTSE